jgi:dynein heavy chain
VTQVKDHKTTHRTNFDPVLSALISEGHFDPAKVANASSAAEGLTKWILAMEIYDRVAKVVAPKKEKLKEAEDELSTTIQSLVH